MSSEFIRRFREAAEGRAKPLRPFPGNEAAVVMAELLVEDAERIEAALRMERKGTADAAEVTGWSIETLQKYARAKLAGQPLAQPWRDLDVTEDGGYWFVVGTIPEKLRAAS